MVDGWRIKRGPDLSDGVFIAVVLAAGVLGATLGTCAVWVWERLR